MTLKFEPPPAGLLQDYYNRPQPAEIANQGIQQALQTYAQMKQQEQAQQLSQEDRDIKLAGLASEGGTNSIDTLNAIRRSRGLGPISIPQQTQYTPIQQIQGMTPVEMQAQQSIPAEHPVSESPIIAHWNQTMGKPTPPVLGSDPAIQEFNDIGSQAYLQKYGQKGMAKVKTALDIQKGLQDKNSATPISTEQYLALQSGKAEDLNKAFPGGIPKEYVSPSLSATARNIAVVTSPITGETTRVPKGGGPAEIVQTGNRPPSEINPLQSKLNPKEYTLFTQAQNDFDADPVVKADRNILANLNQINAEISKYNPAMTGPLKSQQARAIAREVGALTDSDVARQALDPSMIGRLKSFVSVAATGKVPEDQLNLLKDSVSVITHSASNRISRVAKERSARLSQNVGGKVSADEFYKNIVLPTEFSSPSNTQSSNGWSYVGVKK